MPVSGKSKVIIITGPCGVGKTTIANILATKLEIQLISGDEIRRSLFPDIDDITEYPKKLQVVKEHIFKLSKSHYSSGKSVLIDYVVLGSAYITRFQNAFADDLMIKVIFPSRATAYQRDLNRECWTSGRMVIDQLYDKYLSLMPIIGEENYMDNGHETSDESTQTILCAIQSNVNH